MSNAFHPNELQALLENALANEATSTKFYQNHPMSLLTTFAIGGPADLVVEPTTEESISIIAKTCRSHAIPLRVLGFGSNLLVSDNGLPGVVLRLAENFSQITINQDDLTITAQAGASNEALSNCACAAGLSGYEFACGIPGSLGGAALMNAGAYDGDFSHVGKDVTCLTPDNQIVKLNAEEAQWSYRHSLMQDNDYIVLAATIQLHKDDPSAIQARIDDLTERRTSKQPLEMPSAGSTFKRPEGYFVGQLIEEAGLKGHTIGGAQVSEKHTGFVVNANNATAQDVCDLIAHIQSVIKECAGVSLQPEVRFWGFEE